MATDSNYPGMDDEASPFETPDDAPEKEHKEDEGATALLPKSFFEGKDIKPGEQYYVEIVRSYEDEVEVKYPHQIKGEESDEESGHDKLEAMGRETQDSVGGY
jgi:hypothetical protein